MHAFDKETDRRTDGQTAFSSLDRVCIACNAVKNTFRPQVNLWCRSRMFNMKKFPYEIPVSYTKSYFY